VANVRCVNDKFVEPIDAADRSELKITVKLFMYNTNEETLRSAVNSGRHNIHSPFYSELL
jgi:hypothetical protein